MKKQNTIKRSELSPLKMGDGKGKPCKVIDKGILHEYVGIGWISLGPSDNPKYPVVVE